MGNLKNLREEFNEINLKFCQILLSKMALGDDKFSKPEGKFYWDKNGSLREREEIEVPEDESAVSSLFASVEEIKTMPTKQFLDEMVVPILNKALLKVNKERPSNPIEFLGQHLLKMANETPSPEESSKNTSSASTPTPMD